MTIEQIWFGTRAVRFEGGGSTGPQIEVLDAAGDFATRTLPGGAVADFTGSEWQQVLAFVGTAAQQAALGIDLSNGVDTGTAGAVNTTGDLRVGAGVVAHNIADVGGGGRVMDSTGTLDESDDPVLLSGFGKASAGALSGATTDSTETGNRVVFSNDIGFGFINGSGFDPGGNATRLNDGDAINLAVRADKQIVEASFTVKVLGNGSTAVVLDSDGKTIRDTNGSLLGGFVQDASSGELNLGTLAHGTKVKVDYKNELIFINNVAFGGATSAFFDAFDATASRNLTLGSVVGNNTGWSADDLLLSTGIAQVAPVAEGFSGGSGDEDTAIAGQVLATDANDDTLAYSVEAGDAPSNGSVVVNAATGAFTYTPAADFNGTDSFTVTIDDGNGGTATQLVSIVVNPVNDAATFGGTATGGVFEDGIIVAGGTLTVADVDVGEAAFASTGSLSGTYGDFAFTLGAGVWAYTLRNADANVQALAAAQVVQDTLTVQSADGSSTTITVNITGKAEQGGVPAPSPFTGAGDPTDSPSTPAAPAGTYATGTTGPDSVTFTGSTNDLYDGLDGADTIISAGGNDGVYGGAGNDRINAGPGGDWADGGSGADSIQGSTGNDTLLGGSGNDTITDTDTGGLDQIYGEADADILTGAPLVYGGAGNDTVLGTADLADRLFGGSGADSVSGFGGADTLNGGYGADTISGGGGVDRFVFQALNDTNDVITDFASDELLDFSAFAGTLTFRAASSTVFGAVNEVVWHLSGANTILQVNTDSDAGTSEFMVTLRSYASGMVLDDFVL